MSSSPSNDWSKISHPINHSSTTNDTVKPWMMPEALKNAVNAKEEEIELHRSSIVARRRAMDKKELDIGEKSKWIRQTKQQIKKAELEIKDLQKQLPWAERDIVDEERLLAGKQAWVNQEKQKFPLDYPECQPEADSSSSSPATKFSQIAHKFKRPDKDSLKAWRASDHIKEAIVAKEKEIEEHGHSIRYGKEWKAHIEDKIHEKQQWIKEANKEIRSSEQWVRANEASLSEQADEMRAEVKEMNKKYDWVEGKKKKFPYEFPEYQIIDEE